MGETSIARPGDAPVSCCGLRPEALLPGAGADFVMLARIWLPNNMSDRPAVVGSGVDLVVWGVWLLYSSKSQ